VREFIRRRPIFVLALALAVALGCLVWAILVIGRPLPPRTVVMTTGTEGGVYRELGEQYRAALARNGINLELRPSSGNIENLARLKDSSSGVSAGFVAGGLTTAAASPGIESLGTVSYDPIWIFCRGLPDPAQIEDLRGKRISINPEGGLLIDLLHANELETDVTVVPLAPAAGGEALLRGKIDCACMLTGPDAPIVKKLLADVRVNLMTFPRADAYVAIYPFLRKVTIPRGVGSLAKDRPPHDVTLVAPMASLLVRDDLHPAVQFLLLEAAEKIHSGPGLLRRPAQFPAPEPVDVPLSREARDFYKSGGSFLQRHLPFWLAVLTSRLLLVLVPLAGVIYPLASIVPGVINFVMERRLNALYADLRKIEARIGARSSAEDVLEDLRRFDEKVTQARVPASYARALYTLKHHASLVSDRLRAAGEPAAPGRQGTR
jgi:TRAP-type uncharacterized transport system substrate-binding protein